MNNPSARATERLTEQMWWDDYWRRIELPAEVRKSRDHSHNAILGVIDRYLPAGTGLRALEIGGAPGQYLAYLIRHFGYEGHLLDYSSVGCAKSRENFSRLGLPVTVHEGDLFSDALNLGPFDVVYSLGFIEHFTNITEIIGRHVRLLKPGGTLLVGCPNFRGVNGWFLRRLAPELLAKHNVEMMDVETWKDFERAWSLVPLFRGYVGGFEPSVFTRCEVRTPTNVALWASARVMLRAFRARPFKRFNSSRFSHYAMGVYRVPG